MLINEASKVTKLTKKAIDYYTMQGLISPAILGNGYRDYSKQDIDTLNKISVLRKLDISTEEISHILKDTTNEVLQAISVKREFKRELDCHRDMMKKSILQKLSEGKPYEEICAEIQSIEQGKTITEKLLSAFPGFYGRFICMHFARFLNEPIRSVTQQDAYETILSFLDNVPVLDIPKDLESYMVEITSHISTKQISDMLVNTQKTYENPDEFIANNKEMLEQYLEFKHTEEYKNSPACKLLELMKEFNNSNGYNDVFIPAMKQLSKSYAEYFKQAEIANEKLLAQYSQIDKQAK